MRCAWRTPPGFQKLSMTQASTITTTKKPKFPRSRGQIGSRGDIRRPRKTLSPTLSQCRAGDAVAREGTVPELGKYHDPEGEEMRGDPSEPADPSRDVDDEVSRREHEEYREGISEECCPSKTALMTRQRQNRLV